MEGRSQPYSSMPLVSRLDHLDFLMKYLERKQSCNSLGQALERQCVPMDLAAKEADFKGSLLDRVASLEHRLFQVCLGMQSSSTYTSSSSSRASTQTPGDSSSSHGFKGEPSSSFPAFNINAIHGDKLMSHVGVHSHEIQEVKPHRHRVAKELKIASAPRQLLGNGKSNKEEKTCKSQKKGISPNWPRLKILGC